MRIVVTYDNGNVGQHFGKTEAFKVYDVENGAVTKSEVVSTDGKGHKELIPVVTGFGPDAVICGGVGTPMVDAITSTGATLYTGITGDADAAVAALIAGTLTTDPSAVHTCSH